AGALSQLAEVGHRVHRVGAGVDADVLQVVDDDVDDVLVAEAGVELDREGLVERAALVLPLLEELLSLLRVVGAELADVLFPAGDALRGDAGGRLTTTLVDGLVDLLAVDGERDRLPELLVL